MKVQITKLISLFNTKGKAYSKFHPDESLTQSISRVYQGVVFTTGKTCKNTYKGSRGVVVGFSRSGMPLVETLHGEIYAVVDVKDWVQTNEVMYYIYEDSVTKEIKITTEKVENPLHVLTRDISDV